MSKTWILVAHRAGARLFLSAGPGKGLALVRNIDHPEGRLKGSEIVSDRQGRAFESHGAGRHAYEAPHDPTDSAATQFARELAAILDQGRNEGRYEQLVLVAEARFLGMLRGALSREAAARVSHTLEKDLGAVSEHDLPSRLQGIVAL